MKTTTTTATARRLLRESNPVPDDAFMNATRDHFGQAAFDAILSNKAEDAWSPDHAPAGPGQKGPRSPVLTRYRWQIVVPVAAAAAAVAVGVSVSVTSAPTRGTAPRVPLPASGTPTSGTPTSGALNSLAANMTYHPSASPADAAAILRRLANAAAGQPSPALGPVVYSKSAWWGLDLGAVHYDLSYRSHELSTDENWMGQDGASLSVTTYANGKIPPGVIPVSRSGPSARGRAAFAWWNPATLPSGPAALRKHLLNNPWAPPAGQPAGSVCVDHVGSPGHPGKTVCSPSHASSPDEAQTIMSSSLALMTNGPLPSAVRASMLRLIADEAARRVPDARFVDMGTVTDRAGHTGVAIGYEIPASAPAPVSLQVLIFDPGTGALLDQEFAYCNGKIGSYPARGSCFPTSYSQDLQIKAVPSIPASPPASNPSASPGVPTANLPTP